MHNKFIDKNRRLFNLRQMQVRNVLPEHFAQYYPKFVTLLEKYYDWQNEQDATELVNHLFAARDINETDITLLSYIEDELLLGEAYFKGFGDNDAELRAAANFSNTLFRSKGTKFAIEWFFRSFYGVDAEVLYPKENIFKIGDTSSTLGASSQRYLTDDKLYQTYALLVRVGIPISKWKDTFKLFAHPAGMYLGGEVLLTDIKNIVTALPQGDSAVTTRNIPSYTLTADTTSINEGQSINFTVDGSNVVDNTDVVYYYMQHVTTNDSDFTTFYDSNNAQYVSVNDSAGNARGSFIVNTNIDVADAESPEEFKVIIRDRHGNLQDSATITMANVASTYTLSVDSSTFLEGQTMNFVITGLASNPDPSTLQYYVDPIGSNPITVADFTTTPPLVGSPQSITIENDSARFSLSTLIEPTSVSDSDKTFRVLLKNDSFLKDSSGTITVQHVTPQFNLSFVNSTVTENSFLQATLDVEDYSIGTIVDWSLSGAVASDSRVSQPTGSLTLTANSNNFVVPFLGNDSAVGSVSGTLNISPRGHTPDPYTTGSFTLIDADPVYSIVPTPSAAAEGDSATFTFVGTNIPDGTTAYFYVDFDETDSSDFVSLPPLSDNRTAITFTNNVGSPNVTLQFAVDGDPTESFIANLSSSNVDSDNADLTTRNFNITDTILVLTPDTTSVNEGNSVVFTLDSAAGIPTTTYYYTLSGTNITASDFVSNSLTGSFPVSSAGGTFSVSLANDLSFEGSESFIAEVSETLGGTPIVSSTSITINDTSLPNYTFVANDVTEGSEFVATISGSGSTGERLYFEISGDATSKFSNTQINSLIDADPKDISFGLTLDSDAYESNPQGTITATRNDYLSNGGSTVVSDTFNILDKIATATLTASNTTPNEDSDVTFTISNSTNLPPIRYYSISNSIVHAKASSEIATGQNTIPLLNTSGLQVGMETSTTGINGTITSVLINSVEMSENVTSTVSSGEILHFAQPEVFDDFNNLPHGSTDSDTFVISIALDNDVSNDTYTFVLRDSDYNGNVIATESITIQDQTTGLVDFVTPTVAYDLVVQSSANAIIRFKSDGIIRMTLNGTEQDAGTWATGSFDGANYTLNAELIASSGGTPSGSFGTDLTLDVDRQFSVSVPFITGTEGQTQSARFNAFIQGPTTDNFDSEQFTMTAVSTSFETDQR